MEVTTKVECPCCNHINLVEIYDYDEGHREIECEVCGISMSFYYYVSVEVRDINITNIPPIDVECPKCGGSLEISIYDKSGSTEVCCDNCGTALVVSWSDCGRDVDVDFS
jgi:ribosomal protein S27E